MIQTIKWRVEINLNKLSTMMGWKKLPWLYKSPQFFDPKMTVMGFSHLVLPTFLPDSKRRISRETLFRNQSAAFFEKTSNSAQVGGGAQLVKLGLLNSKIILSYGIIIKMSNILNMRYPTKDTKRKIRTTFSIHYCV